MTNLDLGVIGNSAISALIDSRGRIVWCCLPRVDGDPTFCRLLAGDRGDAGVFAVELDGFAGAEQRYLRHTAVLATTLRDRRGAAVEIVDFAPRFKQYGRTFRPLSLVRRLRPAAGAPRIAIRLRPAHSWGAGRPERTRGSNHIRYVMPGLALRCTTDAPVSYVWDETPFVLERPVDLLLGPDESLTLPLAETCRRFLDDTHAYWREWIRYLSLPPEWQDAVIRAAITLKLSNYEETGGIVAAMTTSVPEAPDSGRNWDYRYCWLRDAYFVVRALNRLGATRTMEGHIRYIVNLAAAAGDRLQPVYGVTLEPDLSESVVPSLPGYRGMGPTRRGNQAHEHVQNDVYGSAIMAATQAFFDERLASPGDRALFERLEPLGARAAAVFDAPDAGLWEFRSRAQVHTFSAVMCWAACDRLAKIAARLALPDRARRWRGEADRLHGVICERAFDPGRGGFTETFGGDTVDASLLLLHELGFVAPRDPRFLGTLRAVENALKRGGFLFRYTGRDDFGVPRTAFIVCTFWYIGALAATGRRAEARELFEAMLARRNHLGLLSEDIDPATGELWGNFPQTYSMVGLVDSAMRLSKGWDEAL